MSGRLHAFFVCRSKINWNYNKLPEQFYGTRLAQCPAVESVPGKVSGAWFFRAHACRWRRSSRPSNPSSSTASRVLQLLVLNDRAIRPVVLLLALLEPA